MEQGFSEGSNQYNILSPGIPFCSYRYCGFLLLPPDMSTGLFLFQYCTAPLEHYHLFYYAFSWYACVVSVIDDAVSISYSLLTCVLSMLASKCFYFLHCCYCTGNLSFSLPTTRHAVVLFSGGLVLSCRPTQVCYRAKKLCSNFSL